MRLLFVLFFIFYRLHALFAQNPNNYFEVLTNTGLNFNLDNATDIENNQTLNNALTLRLKTNNQNCSEYARLFSYLAPAGFYLLCLSAVGYDYPTGSYNFTLQFTMPQL
jgi:hypothetical protein